MKATLTVSATLVACLTLMPVQAGLAQTDKARETLGVSNFGGDNYTFSAAPTASLPGPACELHVWAKPQSVYRNGNIPGMGGGILGGIIADSIKGQRKDVYENHLATAVNDGTKEILAQMSMSRTLGLPPKLNVIFEDEPLPKSGKGYKEANHRMAKSDALCYAELVTESVGLESDSKKAYLGTDLAFKRFDGTKVVQAIRRHRRDWLALAQQKSDADLQKAIFDIKYTWRNILLGFAVKDVKNRGKCGQICG